MGKKEALKKAATLGMMGGSNMQKLRIRKGETEQSCEQMGGRYVRLDDDTEACIWIEDEEGKPIDEVDITVVSPGTVELSTPEGEKKRVEV